MNGKAYSIFRGMKAGTKEDFNETLA